MECVDEDEVEVLVLAELPNMAIFSYLLHGHDMEGLVLTIISWQVASVTFITTQNSSKSPNV